MCHVISSHHIVERHDAHAVAQHCERALHERSHHRLVSASARGREARGAEGRKRREGRSGRRRASGRRARTPFAAPTVGKGERGGASWGVGAIPVSAKISNARLCFCSFCRSCPCFYSLLFSSLLFSSLLFASPLTRQCDATARPRTSERAIPNALLLFSRGGVSTGRVRTADGDERRGLPPRRRRRRPSPRRTDANRPTDRPTAAGRRGPTWGKRVRSCR